MVDIGLYLCYSIGTDKETPVNLREAVNGKMVETIGGPLKSIKEPNPEGGRNDENNNNV